MSLSRILLLLLLLIPRLVLAELEISDAQIKHLPASVPVRAGYMTIQNPGSTAASIVALRSKAFASVEIHRSFEQDGMMRMEAIPTLVIEAGASVKLAPGGLHLMMMGPVEPTHPGAKLNVIIVLDDGSQQSLEMTVVK